MYWKKLLIIGRFYLYVYFSGFTQNDLSFSPWPWAYFARRRKWRIMYSRPLYWWGHPQPQFTNAHPKCLLDRKKHSSFSSITRWKTHCGRVQNQKINNLFFIFEEKIETTESELYVEEELKKYVVNFNITIIIHVIRNAYICDRYYYL